MAGPIPRVDRFDEVEPRIVRSRSVSRARALRVAQPRSGERSVPRGLKILADRTTLVTLVVEVEGRRHKLRLQEFEPALEGVELVATLPDGSLRAEPVRRNGTRFFTGRVARDDDSVVNLFRTAHAGWGGEVLVDGQTFVLEPKGWSEPMNRALGGDGETSASYVFRAGDLDENRNPPGCATAESGSEPAPPGDDEPANPRHIVENLAIKKYDVKYVASRDYLQARGNDDNVVSQEIFAMHHGTSNVMQGQLYADGIALHWVNAQILDARLPAPWFLDDPLELDGNDLLSSLVSCKKSTDCLGGFVYGSGTVSVLLVDRPLVKTAPETGALAGIARRGSLCGLTATAVVDAANTLGSRFARLAHELGHVFGACHDGPVPGQGCAVTSCPLAGLLMTPSIGESTAPAYSVCSVAAMNSKIAATSTCRSSVYCGDVDANGKNFPNLCRGQTIRSTATDALVALKLAIGQAQPGYSHLADVSPPFGVLNTTDANDVLQYATCGMHDVVPQDCGL